MPKTMSHLPKTNKRKPQENKAQVPQDESSLAAGEKDAEKEGTTGNLDCSELTEKKEKKKDKEKKESLDFDLEVSGESKKLKQDHSEGRKNSDINNLGENGSSDGLDVKKKRNSRLDSKGNLVEVNAHMMGYGKDGGSGIGNKNKKKKRKRDELELEYEASRYGEADKQEKENDVVGEKRKKMNNPEDMMVSKEGFDDENKLLRTVFVGNLPLKMKKKALLKEFAKFGEVESVRIRSVPIIDKHNLKLRDRELRLSHAKSNSTPSKRENISLPETYNTPAKKFAVDSRYSGSDNKVKAKANVSYQGMRASKSGTQKKAPARVNAPAKSKFGSSMEKPVKGKRPAVAAGKLKAQQAANAPKQVGIKRKLDNRTPDTAGQKKKARKFR
ncbi:unnamed protein product [Fraxinus pennsylvanica]|uniref:RRM domain-containing protein n=1 Tax=Fraxinus pennsylvanica TaxID=56036 RepID=A0AAD2E989_9LAMI|nr:unnamed protein product [Fraxinus pennsylvanica]